MDFGSLIHKAQQNGQSSKKEIRYYSTKFEPPKKEERSKRLSANIQKFLARKEEEEKKNAELAKKKRDQLLELRSKDKKAVKRVNVMLKRTKSANQSVIQDAVDADNTELTLAGSSQPDEDDYGYVSQSASEFYNKMMEKYNKMPDEPKFQLHKKKGSTNLNNTKARVKAALDREREEELHPHRRKRKSKEMNTNSEQSTESKEANNSEDEFTPEKPKKPKLKPAPVVNFSDLLKLAEKKQHEPIIIEQKEKEEERLLTKKQKRELEKEREYKERREQMRQHQLSTPINKKISKPTEDPKNQKEIASKSDNSGIKKNNVKTVDNKIPQKDIRRIESKVAEDRSKIGSKNTQSSKNLSNIPTERSNNFEPPHRGNQGNSNVNKFKQEKIPYKGTNNVVTNKTKERIEPPPKTNGYPKQPISSNSKLRPVAPGQSKPKQFPPRDLHHLPERGPMKPKLQVNKGRILDDDDEEYDSEMDDFIDDGPEEGEDYSKYISEIFGYDKKKYSYIDEDDDNMESSFAQQMREEVISTKIGIMEDLEDIKLEEEMKKKKAQLKKKYK